MANLNSSRRAKGFVLKTDSELSATIPAPKMTFELSEQSLPEDILASLDLRSSSVLTRLDFAMVATIIAKTHSRVSCVVGGGTDW